MRIQPSIEEPEPIIESVTVVARYGEGVLRHRQELRKATLQRDIESLKVTLEFVLDELERESEFGEEAGILLVRHRIEELESNWRAVTSAFAAQDLGRIPSELGPEGRRETAAA